MRNTTAEHNVPMKIKIERTPELQAAIATDQAAWKSYPYRPDYNNGPMPMKIFGQLIGGGKWVLARRTPYITSKYGDTVICLSQQRYTEVERLARLLLTEGYD